MLLKTCILIISFHTETRTRFLKSEFRIQFHKHTVTTQGCDWIIYINYSISTSVSLRSSRFSLRLFCCP